MVKTAPLNSRALVSVTGADTVDFLQGLISNDMRKLTPLQPIYAALLSPQGKYLFDFIISATEGGVLLDVDAARADDLVKRLSMYRLRAQVAIAKLADKAVYANWGGDSTGGMADPRHAKLGRRIIADAGSVAVNATEQEYEAYRISLAIPEGVKDMVADKSLLLEFGFEQLHGVDFAKGCYVGQEVTARSKHRAQLRKALHKVSADTVLPVAGTEIMCDGKLVGEMRSSAGGDGLAILQFDAIASQKELKCENIVLRAALPDWFDKALASAAD